MQQQYGDVEMTLGDDFVALCEIQRPPNNHFDLALIKSLAQAFEDLDANDRCRAIVLAAQGKHFCAGANFASRDEAPADDSGADRSSGNPLYSEAVRLFACKKPVVAAVQGAAVGGGLGLAVMADFRVVCPATRLTSNFVKLGFHPGFGLTYTLPRLIGQQRANLLFYSGRRINGREAFEWGLGDVFAEDDEVRDEARRLAREIAENAPLALLSVRETMRVGIADEVKKATDHENVEQVRLQRTEDFREGVRAVAERRPGNFVGR